MDIKQIKLGNSTYDIKDQISRNGFNTAQIEETTDLTVGNGNLLFSRIAFYDSNDTNTRNELGSVNLENLTIPDLTTTTLIAGTKVFTPELGILNSSDSLWADIGIALEGTKPFLYFTSTDTGSPNGNVNTTVKLPVGASGTIALTSDVNSVQSDVDTIKTLLNIEGTDVQGTIDKYDEIVDFLDGLSETPTLVTQLAGKADFKWYGSFSAMAAANPANGAIGYDGSDEHFYIYDYPNGKWKPLDQFMQRVVINMGENNHDLIFTDVDNNPLTHYQVKDLLNDPNIYPILKYNNIKMMYRFDSSYEDYWEFERKELFSTAYVDLAWDGVSEIIIDDEGDDSLRDSFMATTHPANAITSAKISQWDGSYVPLFIQLIGTTVTFKDTNNTAVSNSDVYSILNDSTKNVVLFDSNSTYIYHNVCCAYADEFIFVSGYEKTIDSLFIDYINNSFTLREHSNFDLAEKIEINYISTTGAVSQALDANKFYKFTGALTSLTLTLNASTGFAVYAGKFTTGSGWGSNGLSIPATVTEAANNDEIEASKTYEFSIVDNVIVIKEV